MGRKLSLVNVQISLPSQFDLHLVWGLVPGVSLFPATCVWCVHFTAYCVGFDFTLFFFSSSSLLLVRKDFSMQA